MHERFVCMMMHWRHGKERWPEIRYQLLGGVIVTNQTITIAIATELSKLFFEVLVAPS